MAGVQAIASGTHHDKVGLTLSWHQVVRYGSFQGLGMLKIIIILTLFLSCLSLLSLLLLLSNSLILVSFRNDIH